MDFFKYGSQSRSFSDHDAGPRLTPHFDKLQTIVHDSSRHSVMLLFLEKYRVGDFFIIKTPPSDKLQTILDFWKRVQRLSLTAVGLTGIAAVGMTFLAFAASSFIVIVAAAATSIALQILLGISLGRFWTAQGQLASVRDHLVYGSRDIIAEWQTGHFNFQMDDAKELLLYDINRHS